MLWTHVRSVLCICLAREGLEGWVKLTGALGLMMTLGVKPGLDLEGVPGPDPPTLLAPPTCCCWPPNCAPLPKAAALCCPCDGWFTLLEASPEGRGLLRPSVNWVCDEVGVPWAEPEGELEAPCDGDEVPELESFFFDDFSILFRESCGDGRVSVNAARSGLWWWCEREGKRERGGGEKEKALYPLSNALHGRGHNPGRPGESGADELRWGR